jgi:hypothetical protein
MLGGVQSEILIAAKDDPLISRIETIDSPQAYLIELSL